MNGTFIAKTNNGKARGYRTENEIICFKGIPYAEPPIGELRFSPPHPKKRWEGVLDARNFGPIAPQPVLRLSSIDLPEQSEADCLTLNIWTPALDDKKRTVMFWIHGGAFEMGSGRYNGESLAKRGDVVIVSINYRLGALGFLYVPGKTANVGLLDQVLALKWVKNNINSFGGNANDICVFGESAGGESISALLAMPTAKELFKRAIIQSNVCDPYNLKPKKAEVFSKRIFEIVGVKYDDLASLRKVPFEKLVKSYTKAQIGLSDLPMIIDYYPPYIDGKILPQNPFEAISKGFAKDVEILAGTNENEHKLWTLMDPKANKITEEQVNKNFGMFLKFLNQDSPSIKKFIEVYKNNGYTKLSTKERDMMDDFYTDVMFRIPVLRFLEIQSKIQPNVYHYFFKWKSPWLNGILGAYHGLDVAFVWGTLTKVEELYVTKRTEETTLLSNQMMDCWINFAKSGNPNHQGIPQWPKYNLETRPTMIFDKKTEVMNDPLPHTRIIWDGII
ncbi:MAG: carboxylesterase/lipase family protein [Promethearchaeota archaeon]|jgi:para-nitrobenzyl esterase